MTFNLLTFERTKNLFVTLVTPNRSIRETIYRNYQDIYEQGIPGRRTNLTKLRKAPSGKFSLQDCPSPRVSIIIPVFNQWETTRDCLFSIAETCGEESYEVILADDNSSDATARAETLVDNLRVHRNPANLGFLRNCNAAALQAKGEYLVFLNNDTLVMPGWLQTLVDSLDKHPRVGMVGSMLIYPDGRLQEAGGIIWRDGSAWNYGRLDDPDKPEYNYFKETDYISGASLMVRRSIWEAVGGFDERFAPAYYEDTDLAFAVRAQGFTVCFQPLSVCLHLEGISHGRDEAAGLKQHQVVNRQTFLEKWSATLEREHFPYGENVFSARDRSRFKKTVLFIDHYVPQHDKDAGSKSTFQYVQLMAELGYNIKFLGDNFFPHQPYTTQLQQMGVEVLYSPHYQQHWREWLRSATVDVVYLHRPHIARKYLPICKATSAKLLYQCHDLHFLRKQREYASTKDPEALKEAEEWKQLELELCRQVDALITFSDHELQVMGQLLPDLTVHQIPLFFYDHVPPAPTSFADRKNLLFVGGFGHPPNVDALLWFAGEILPEILRVHPDILLHVVGSNPPREIQVLYSERIQVHGFVSEERLAFFFQTSRVGVNPLRFGAGVKGKIVESLYHGLPVVATSVGMEGIPGLDEIIEPRDTVESFAQECLELLGNEELLLDRSQKQRDIVHRHFSREAVKDKLKTIFGSDQKA